MINHHVYKRDEVCHCQRRICHITKCSEQGADDAVDALKREDLTEDSVEGRGWPGKSDIWVKKREDVDTVEPAFVWAHGNWALKREEEALERRGWPGKGDIWLKKREEDEAVDPAFVWAHGNWALRREASPEESLERRGWPGKGDIWLKKREDAEVRSPIARGFQESSLPC